MTCEAGLGREAELKRAMKKLFDELSKGVSAVGAMFKDDQAKKELTEAVSVLADRQSEPILRLITAAGSWPRTLPPPRV